MKKVIKISKGPYVWHVDLEYVAANRAKYYADKDPDTTYEDEFKYVWNDDYEGIDWFQNNMNYEDVPFENRKLVRQPRAEPIPEDIEDDGDYEIVTA